MGLRDLYNAVEKVATPIANAATRSEEFAQLTSTLTGVNKFVRDQSNKVAARAWHLINLPAGTDVQRLKMQVGSLDREVRLLSLELKKAREEEKSRGRSRPKRD